MPKSNRREFLKQTSAGVAAAAAFPLSESFLAAEPATPATFPPHRPFFLSGLHAYVHQRSVAAGETIKFLVSATVPYELSVCRLGPKVDDPSSDEVLHVFAESEPASQPIFPGSYVHIEKGLSLPIRALTLECWVRLWKLNSLQGLVTQQDFPVECGFGLFISSESKVMFYLGDGGPFHRPWLHTGPKLKQRQWHHVVGTWDGRTKSLWVDGELAGEWAFSGPVNGGRSPLRLGAFAHSGLASHFLDGDLAMPAIYGRVLHAAEIRQRFSEKGLKPARGKNVLARWPLMEERGSRVADASLNKRHGRIINHATWMIGGPSFNGAEVPRYANYDPAKDKNRGHGLRLAADDLYDCDWKVTHQYRIPASAKSGIYVGRIKFTPESKPLVYDTTFIVRKCRSRARAPILMLCSSNTWTAYSATPFAANVQARQFWGTNGLANSRGNPPAYCCYRNHEAGQPTYQIGLRLPWPAAGPDVLYSPQGVGYSHLMRTERFAHVWLDQAGYDYDAVSDFDLHREPDLLKGYQTIVINGHSEYWSIEAYESVDRYLRNGGTAIVMSGNTMFWRVTFNSDGTIMECRKFDERIGGRANASIGELFHSHDTRRGSLMRECGYPAWKVVGLECAGWGGTNAEDIGIYHTDAPDHFLFHQPERIDLEKNETFGHAPGGSMPKAIGHEWDVRLSTLIKMTAKIPTGASLPDEPPGIVTLARGVRKGGGTLDYFTAPTKSIEGVCAEMIYWERPKGGRVFHAGAIGAGWALSADPKFQTLMRNVLHHFGVKPKSNDRSYG